MKCLKSGMNDLDDCLYPPQRRGNQVIHALYSEPGADTKRIEIIFSGGHIFGLRH